MEDSGSSDPLEDDRISVLTEADESLFYHYNARPEGEISAGEVKFEDSYEYIRLYFDSGDWKGYRYHDDKSLIYFAGTTSGAKRYKIFKPLGANSIDNLNSLVEQLKGTTKQSITVVCVSPKLAAQLEGYKKKQFKYLIFNIEGLGELAGQRWKNVRQKITKFKREFGKVKIERLSETNKEKVVHFISDWRRSALENRGFSYAQVGKGKFAARFYSDKIDERNLWAYVYFIKGRVTGFQMLYRLSPNAAANPIGLSDIEIDGLAEFSQVHAWTQLSQSGIKYINDGPSWRKSLDQFKRKFNPVAEQTVFELSE